MRLDIGTARTLRCRVWETFQTMLIHNGGPCIINHLMTGPKGNIEIEGKQNSLFPVGPVI